MVESIDSITEAKRQKTLELFRGLTQDSSHIVLSDHFSDRWDEKLPHLNIRHFMRALREGQVVKVGPGKFKNWKVEVTHLSAGEEYTIVCDVDVNRLVLVTCWGGSEDGKD